MQLLFVFPAVSQLELVSPTNGKVPHACFISGLKPKVPLHLKTLPVLEVDLYSRISVDGHTTSNLLKKLSCTLEKVNFMLCKVYLNFITVSASEFFQCAGMRGLLSITLLASKWGVQGNIPSSCSIGFPLKGRCREGVFLRFSLGA